MSQELSPVIRECSITDFDLLFFVSYNDVVVKKNLTTIDACELLRCKAEAGQKEKRKKEN